MPKYVRILYNEDYRLPNEVLTVERAAGLAEVRPLLIQLLQAHLEKGGEVPGPWQKVDLITEEQYANLRADGLANTVDETSNTFDFKQSIQDVNLEKAKEYLEHGRVLKGHERRLLTAIVDEQVRTITPNLLRRLAVPYTAYMKILSRTFRPAGICGGRNGQFEQ